MIFSSPLFFAFFAAYLLLHFYLPLRLHLALIILGSTIFYAHWNPLHLWVPYALILIGFIGARWIMQAAEAGRRRWRLASVVVALLLPLIFVKYGNFLYSKVLGPLTGHEERIHGLALPLGISFFTFTLIAYVVEVYRGAYQPEQRLDRLTGFVLFFPHMAAGPILRPRDLLPQLYRPRRSSRVGLVYGFAIFSLGMLKKMVFADPMAEVVDPAFANPENCTAAQCLLAIYAFTVQIYCDFSGYTDMAIGSALMLGFRLPENFQAPYTSDSIAKFWRRWHMTLSNWLRDYVYIPLGGNRRGLIRQTTSILLTMGLGGLWHGANWTFVLWGILNGFAVAFVHLLRRSGLSQVVNGIPRWLLVLGTFHFVAVGWTLFRAEDLEQALQVLTAASTFPLHGLSELTDRFQFQLVLLTIFFVTHRWDNHRLLRQFVSRMPPWALWPLLGAVWLLSITVSAGTSAKFIYFDF